MQLYFRNNHGPRIWVAVMYYDPSGCGSDGAPWATKGWWAIDNGGTAYVLKTNNRYVYWYAESADGSVWQGGYGGIFVPNSAFQWCSYIASTNSEYIGLRRSHITADKWTVTLV